LVKYFIFTQSTSTNMIPEALKWELITITDRVYEDEAWLSLFSMALHRLDASGHLTERKLAGDQMQSILMMVETLVPDQVWQMYDRFMGTILQSDYFAHPTAVIDIGATIGSGTKIWHFCHIMTDSSIGLNCNIGQNVLISPGVALGNNVKVQNNVSLYTGVTCEDDVFLGPSVVLTNVTNPRSAIPRRGEYKQTHIGKGASIGANATLICGHPIGQYAFIGAGAVVTKDVPDFALMVGNPAKQSAWIGIAGEKLVQVDTSTFKCPSTEDLYFLDENKLIKK